MLPSEISAELAPRFTADDAARVARDLYGVVGSATELPSERDQNWLVHSTDDRRYVLKIANGGERREVLDAENPAMHRLAATGLTPTLVASTSGADIGEHASHFVRLITYVDGETFARCRRHGDALLQSLGRAVATVDHGLDGFDHPALHRSFHWDLARAEDVVEELLPLVRAPEMRAAIDTMLASYRRHAKPMLSELPTGIIHGDANDYNVLVDPVEQRVTGLVDFGDMVHSHVVNDLAVAIAYAVLGQRDPLAVAAQVTRGYHGVRPLSDAEVTALFTLTGMRLCVSICLAARQQAERPDHDYLGISQGPIALTLPALVAIHPRLAAYALRDACGWAPVANTPGIEGWLRAHQHEMAPLTGHDLCTAIVLPVDLSAGSTLLSSDPRDNEAEPLGRRIFARMAEAGAVVGAGGYDEARVIYAGDGGTAHVRDEQRTVHVAVDLTLPSGSALFAPLDGLVHGFEDATDRHDYGPVIVLRHDIPVGPGGVGLSFYTLYGHLSRSSLVGLEIGRPVRRGQRFAEIGSPPSNGDWWPHVHFQIVTDMLDVPCNVDGVVLASRRSVGRSLSPDPNLLLGIPAASLPATRPKVEILRQRRHRIGANLSVSYGDQPLNIVRGWKQYLYDEQGRAYVDCYNNVPHVGHAHPRVVRAVSAQLATLNTNTRYLQDQLVRYADALAAQLPDPLGVCFFTASGSEANELALRLARAHTGARDLVVMDSAYHGHTTTLIDISPYKHSGPGGMGAPDWVHPSPIPDVYRGAHRGGDAGPAYAREVFAAIDAIRERGRGLCGYIAETCPSVGGQLLLPEGYLPEVYRAVREAGGVCIVDEVQTGFGRIGTHFWAFEAHDVVPDIVVLGKPIANGYPMGAVVTTAEIAASFDNGMEFFSTFGGSTAACVAALATLEVTVDEGLQDHALRVGARLLAGLRPMIDRHALVGDVRGSGLFLGVELVRDRSTLEPATIEADAVVRRMRELGVLVGTDGSHHNVIKLRGPMPLSTTDADLVVETLDQALAEQ